MVFNYSIFSVLYSTILVQTRNMVHSTLLQLELPNLVDNGEAEGEKLKQVTHRYGRPYTIHVQTHAHIHVFVHLYTVIL